MRKYLLMLILLSSITYALNCGSTPCNCGDTLVSSRTLDGSDNLAGCSGTALAFGADNLLLDCDGLSITGSGEKGLMISEFNNAKIRNCTISDFDYGVYSYNNFNLTLEKNTITSTLVNSTGLYMNLGSNLTDINGTYLNQTYGIYLINTTGLLNISGVNITSNVINATAIYANGNHSEEDVSSISESDAGGDLFVGGEITEYSSDEVINVQSEGTFTVSGATISNDKGAAIEVGQVDTFTIEDSTVTADTAALLVSDTENMNLYDSEITSYGYPEYGLQLQEVLHLQLENTYVRNYGTSGGMYMVQPTATPMTIVITGGEIRGRTYPIYIKSATSGGRISLDFTNTTLRETGGFGDYALYSEDNVISDAKFTGVTTLYANTALRIKGADSVSITDSVIGSSSAFRASYLEDIDAITLTDTSFASGAGQSLDIYSSGTFYARGLYGNSGYHIVAENFDIHSSQMGETDIIYTTHVSSISDTPSITITDTNFTALYTSNKALELTNVPSALLRNNRFRNSCYGLYMVESSAEIIDCYVESNLVSGCPSGMGFYSKNSDVSLYNGNYTNNRNWGILDQSPASIDWVVNGTSQCINNNISINGSLTVTGALFQDNCSIYVQGVLWTPPQPEINITKTANSYATAGEQLNYTILINNTGIEAINLSLYDAYPAGVTFDSSSPSPTTENSSWDLGNLSGDSYTTVNVTVNISSGLAVGTILNNTIILNFSDSSENNYSSNDSAATIVRDIPSIYTAKTANVTLAMKDSQIEYTIFMNNTGNDTAYDVTVTENYPANTTFVISYPSPSTGNNIFSIGSLSANQTATINITITVGNDTYIGSSLNNSYNITYIDFNSVSYLVSNSTTLTIIGNPMISIVKTASNNSVMPGNNLTYTINITNSGEDKAVNLTLEEFYPSDIIFNISQPPPTTGNTLWSLDNLSAGTSTTINITVNVSSTAVIGTALNNTVALNFTDTSSNSFSRNASQTTYVRGLPSLYTNKTSNVSLVGRGAQINYTIFINNTGNDTAYNVTVTESYPANTTATSSIPSPTIGDNIFAIGNLSANETTTINITITVGNNTYIGDVLNNSYTVSYADFNDASYLASNSTTTEIIGHPTITLTKTANTNYAMAGDAMYYTINITNSGDDKAVNTSLQEFYPTGVAFNNSQPTPTAGNATWNLGNLSANTTTTINITINVSELLPVDFILNNTVSLNFSDTSNNSFSQNASHTATVHRSPNIITNKTANVSEIVKGAQIIYTIFMNNTGNDTAINVTLTENYPENTTFVSSSPSPTSGNNVFSFDNLLSNESTTINITLTMLTSTYNGSVLNNSYNISYQDMISGQYAASNSTATTVLGYPLISVVKFDSKDPVTQGDNLTYTITITNNGDDTAFNVTLLESYPVGVEFNSSQPLPSSGNAIWNLGDFAPGQSFTVNVSVNVNSSSGTLTNAVNVTYSNLSMQNGTVSASESTSFPSTGGQGGGSGGGSGASSVASVHTMTSDVYTTSSMMTNEKVTFSIQNAEHSLRVLNVYSDRASVRVQSVPQDFTLMKGSVQDVDVNSDGRPDLRITVLDIAYSKVALRLEKLAQQVIPSAALPEVKTETSMPEVHHPEAQPETMTESTADNATEPVQAKSLAVKIAVPGILLILTLIGLIALILLKKEKHTLNRNIEGQKYEFRYAANSSDAKPPVINGFAARIPASDIPATKILPRVSDVLFARTQVPPRSKIEYPVPKPDSEEIQRDEYRAMLLKKYLNIARQVDETEKNLENVKKKK